MAEFALGLTKMAVEGTLSLVKAAVEEEKKLKEVQNDLVFISGELEMMQSFLRVANKERVGNDEVVLTWVRQLRNLAFDVEDCVEFVVHLEIKSSCWWSCWRVCRQKVCGCCCSPLDLDVAIAEIKQLTARVEDVSQRNTRYNLILHGSNSNNNRQQPAVTVVMRPLAEQPDDATTYPSSDSFHQSSGFHILRDAWKATGNWCHDMSNLQDLIGTSGDDDGLQVISVWGSTVGDDLGTTSILTKAYWDPEICEKFKIRAWVKLMHPFNHDEFVKSLLAQFYASSSHQADDADGVDFREEDKLPELMQEMREQRYLVVLENVVAVAQWNVIRMYLPNSKNGSRIVISTPQLGIALLCAGEPVQVSELTKFHGDNQFLCAFFKNKTPRDMIKFYHQLRSHSVISVWGADDDDKSNLIDKLYQGIINGWFKAEHFSMFLEGLRTRIGKLGKVEFKRHSWVDVPDPLDLKVFARRLFLNFHSDDIKASKIIEGGKMGESGLVKWCRESLFEKEDCLVVINGLQSMEDWELIKSTFFSSKATMAKAGCILVITKEEIVAKHCVKDHKYQAFNVEDLKADTSISTLVNKAFWYYYGITGIKGRLFYDRRKDAREWADKFKSVSCNNPDEGKDDDEGFGVFTVAGADAKLNYHYPYKNLKGTLRRAGILRHAYYGAFQQIERRSWVDLPWDTRLDLTDFSWRLLLDFYSDDPQAKEEVAVGLMEGTIIDPIEKCREFLHTGKCLVAINGLWSKPVWDSIKDTFLREDIQSIIIVNSLNIESSTYCSSNVLQLGTLQGFTDTYDKEYHYCMFYTKRRQKALKWTEKFKPVRGESEVHHITLQIDQHRLFSVWGIAGVGKSSLVRTVYYNEMLRSAGPAKAFGICLNLRRPCFIAFGWVDVPSPFNLTEFAWRLLLNLYSDDPQAKQTATISSMTEEGHDPILECCMILREIRCLVVIDGLCSAQDWDLIKATFLSKPINKEGSIVVITNEEKVAMYCVENDKNHVANIRSLKTDVALNLLEKIISKDKESARRLEVLKPIVIKCGGLPKVIAAIGACNSYNTLLSLRHNFMGTLETDPKFHGLRPLFSWMQSYFDACSDSIKPCIFYLSIFSAEKNIRLRRLLWRWIAEGYCRDTSDGRTCEENGEVFISELVNLSIIQKSASSKVFCQINGFFHEYIISRPMEDNLVFALEKGCSLNSTRAGQHLTIRSTWNRRDEVVYESIDFSRLRSLTVFGKWESFFISSKNVNMKLLRVLDLEDATDVTNEDLEQIAKLLPRLKFLSLRGHTKITCLPISMGGLRQLQTLDIRDTSVVMLPLFITKLQKLRYIRAGTSTCEAWDWEGGDVLAAEGEEDRASSSAQVVSNLPPPAAAATPTEGGTDRMGLVLPLPPPAGSSVSCSRPHTLVSSLLSKLRRHGLDNGGVEIGKLSALHTLGVLNVNGSCGKFIFKEIKKLTQLRKLSVSGINKGNIQEFCEAISDHAHLKSLSVEVDKCDNLDGLDDIPQPPNTLHSLKMYGRVNKLLVWMEMLGNNLKKLKLDLTIENPQELEALDFSIPHVVSHLRIRPIQDGDLHLGKVWTHACVVEIECSSVLHIKFGNYDWWKLGVLKVHFSRGSRSSLQISGLSGLTRLKELWLNGYTHAHKQKMQRQIDDMKLQRPNQERPVLKLVQSCSSS